MSLYERFYDICICDHRINVDDKVTTERDTKGSWVLAKICSQKKSLSFLLRLYYSDLLGDRLHTDDFFFEKDIMSSFMTFYGDFQIFEENKDLFDYNEDHFEHIKSLYEQINPSIINSEQRQRIMDCVYSASRFNFSISPVGQELYDFFLCMLKLTEIREFSYTEDEVVLDLRKAIDSQYDTIEQNQRIINLTYSSLKSLITLLENVSAKKSLFSTLESKKKSQYPETRTLVSVFEEDCINRVEHSKENVERFIIKFRNVVDKIPLGILTESSRYSKDLYNSQIVNTIHFLSTFIENRGVMPYLSFDDFDPIVIEKLKETLVMIRMSW